MTYNNCKFPYNLNNFSRPFHCLLFGECKKCIWGPALLFVFAPLSDMRLPTTFLNTNLQLFNSNAIILGQHTIRMPFERHRKTTPFQMHNVIYCKVATICVSVGGICGPNLLEFISENKLKKWAGSHVTKIFSLMLSIFRPSAALEAAVRLQASVRNSIPSQVSVLSSCHFLLTENWGTVFYLTSIKTWALTPSLRPCPPRRAHLVYHHRDRESEIGREENQNG